METTIIRIRKLIFIVTIIIISNFNTAGQEYKVVSFDSDKADLTARTQPRVDNNGRKCAVVKVYADDNIAAVRGSSVGDITGEGMEKLIYLVHDATQMELVFDKHLPLKIIFMDYGIPSLTGQMTYICKLKPVSEVDIQGSETSTSNTLEALHYSDDYSTSLASIESIWGCRFTPLETNEKIKLKLKGGFKIVDIKDGPLKKLIRKNNFIVQKINDQSVHSIDDLIRIWDELQQSFHVSEKKIILIMGLFPNGRKGYYAVEMP